MRHELQYKIEVEPVMRQALEHMVAVAREYGIEPDEITRAVFSWVRERVENEEDPNFHQYLAADAIPVPTDE